MARKVATQRKNRDRRPAPPTPAPATRGLTTALLVTAAAAAAFAAVLLYIHRQMAAGGGGYTSFCTVSSTISCDAVIGTRFGALLGVPVAAWGLFTYAVLFALAFARERAAGPARDRLTYALVALAAWILLFSAYMAAIAFGRIGALCPFCFAMYATAIVIAVLAWRMAGRDLGPRWFRPASPAVFGAAGVLAAGVAGAAALQLAGEGMTGALLTADQACERDAKFCEWYREQPRMDRLPPAVHVKGRPAAVVTITEFSDFECPACALAFRDLHDVVEAHPERVRVVFHHFPLDSSCNPHVGSRMHPNACLAAAASECAAAAGKFWEYHDRLFDAQNQLGREALITYATELGVDAKTFTTCLDDPATRAKVRADVDAASGLGIESTPTLFINGRKIPGALDRARYDYAIALESQP